MLYFLFLSVPSLREESYKDALPFRAAETRETQLHTHSHYSNCMMFINSCLVCGSSRVAYAHAQDTIERLSAMLAAAGGKGVLLLLSIITCSFSGADSACCVHGTTSLLAGESAASVRRMYIIYIQTKIQFTQSNIL